MLAALYPVLPELWGGSADLAESNNTAVKGEPSFLPADRQTKMWSGGPYGRTLHFGVREHAMGAIMNGITLHGGTRVYGGTFLTFSDYMRGAVRLAALMQLPVTYVWTHDSIGLGEDGPTHQPIEHFAALRAIPGLDFVRPADANETAVAWRTILEHNDRPAGLALSRQNLPVFDRTEIALRRRGRARRLRPGRRLERARRRGDPAWAPAPRCRSPSPPASGSRPTACPPASSRVPCLEWFAEQDQAYRDEVLPPSVRARVSVEAGVPMGWREFVGDAGRIVGLTHYGASAAYTVLYEKFGLTDETPSSPPPARASRRPRSGDAVPAGPRPHATGGLSPPHRRPLTLQLAPRPREEGNDMAQNENLAELSAAGVAVWLDDLSRDRIRTGNLQSLVDEYSVVGVTTNPTIFAAAISGSDSYDDQLHALAVREVERRGGAAHHHRRRRPGRLRPARGRSHDRQPGDGRVSLEVAPGLAHDTDATAAEAAHLWWLVDRPNLFIKIPATEAGLPAITETIANGISVNVTLIFSLERYRAVMDAYLAGLEKRVAERRLARRASPRWPRSSSPASTPRSTSGWTRPGADPSLKGKAGIANAQLAYQAYEEVVLLRPVAGAGGEGRRAAAAAVGLDGRQEPRVQRHDVHQRADRARHGQHHAGEDDEGLRRPRHARARRCRRATTTRPRSMQAVADAGVDLDDVFRVLEEEGVQKFVDSWDELTESVRTELEDKK